MGAFDALTRLICTVAYVSLVVVGIVCMIVGLLYASEVKDGSDFIMYLLAFCGLAMVVVGGLALWAVRDGNWLVLLVVVVADMFILVMLFSAAIIGFMLGMDYKDPVRVGIDKSFADADWKRTFWDTKYCQEKASVKDSCVTLFEELAEQTLSDPSSTYKTGVTVNHIFANCDTQGARCITTAKDSDKKLCQQANISSDTITSRAKCVSITGGTNGCHYIAASSGVKEACIPKADCNIAQALNFNCKQCVYRCREVSIADVKKNVEPASLAVFCVIGFCFICIVVNDFLTQTDDFGGLWKVLAWGFNGLVTLSGLVVAVLCGVGQGLLMSDCPDGADCSNMAVIVVLMLGVALLVVGTLGLIGVWKEIPLFLKKVNILLAAVSALLLLAGIMLAIVAGHMDTINGKSEEHFPEMRRQYESKDPTYCQIAGGASLPVYTKVRTTVQCGSTHGAKAWMANSDGKNKTKYPDTASKYETDFKAGFRLEGGPNWPHANSTDEESRLACEAACNNRNGCNFLIWRDVKTCETYTQCISTEKTVTTPAGVSVYTKGQSGAQRMTDADCRAKIKADLELDLLVIGLISAFVCGGFVVVIFFTIRAVKMLRDGDGGDDDGGDDDGGDDDDEDTE